jgi:hypothetical protein
MVARSLALIMLTLATLGAAQQPGPQMPDPQAMQMQAQRIMQERPREAEAAARAFIHLMSLQPGLFSAESRLSELDQLKKVAPDDYWSEVAQLTVQFDMVQNLVRRDSARADLVTQMFGLEAMARTLQRAYRNANDIQRQGLRTQIEKVMGAHFDYENQLRLLEIKDIERRLAEVRAETTRRRERRAEFITWAVDDIVRDAVRPR